MCDSCPAHIPGPGEVAGGVAGLAADGIIAAAKSKIGRRVMFWTLAIPMFLGIIWYMLGWLVVPIALGVVALGGVVLLAVRVLHRAVVVPAATPAQRVAELERRRRNAIPVPVRAAQPELPRAMRRQLGRGRLAQPFVKVPAPRPAHELPASPRVIQPTAVVRPRRAR